jgi:hypothetical protein
MPQTLTASSVIAIRKELDYLYSRRSSLDKLIRTLEQYERLCRKPAPVRPRRVA